MGSTAQGVVQFNGLPSDYEMSPPSLNTGDSMTPDSAVAAMAALGHNLRLEIWRILAPLGPIGLSAGKISDRLGVPPSSLSFHLQQMTHSRVLVQRRSSRQIIYAVDHEIINGLSNFLINAGGDLIRLAPIVLVGHQSDDIADER